ncbi:MAG: HDOD domain-containing protein [Azonexus sp.]|jgi:EAL and modified HD-GYP domain-containing signal transduction protein|nr:HDOD domain-containing protein [Azonexus sp.]
MPSSAFLFIHPLLDTGDSWSAYYAELSPAGAGAGDDILQQLAVSPWLDDFDQRHPWLLPATATPLASGRLGQRAVTTFPALPSAAESAALAAEETALRQASRPLALATSVDAPLPTTGVWNYLLLTAAHLRSLPPTQRQDLAARSTLVATGVSSHADRKWLVDNACALSTGEFMLARGPLPGRADTTRLKLLQLLALIAEDADNPALEAIFRQESKLSYSLLRLVNSAAMARATPITGFSQAIHLLGRRQLQRWLQLLLYADLNSNDPPNPLLQKAAARGQLMELLALEAEPAPVMENLGDAAFIVGAFSLLDILLNMPLPEIMRQLPLAQEITAALTEKAGPLGGLLRAIHAAEMRDLETAARELDKQGILPKQFLEAQLAALSWAVRIRVAP